MLVHQNNAHKLLISLVDAHECHMEVFGHPHYFPDLAPFDYHVPLNMKRKHMFGIQYRSDDHVISAVDDFFKIRMKASLPLGSMNCKTGRRNM